MLETVLSCFEKLDDWNLTIGGTGELSYKTLKTENITYVGTFTKKEFEDYMKDASLVLAFYDPMFPNNQQSASNKFSEALAFGKQIVTNHGTALSEKVLSEKLGWVINYGNEEELEKVLANFRMQKHKNVEFFRKSSLILYSEMVNRYNKQLHLLSIEILRMKSR
jgi:glycosyltransferase involved in cell wall biosynthesis